MKLNHLVQNYFLKKRIVFLLKEVDLITNKEYIVKVINENLLEEHEKFFVKHINYRVLKERISNPNCQGFLAIHTLTNTPVGFEWVIYSRSQEYLHDKFVIPREYGFLFNAFVTEEHRNKGVFKLIKSFAINYMKKQKKCSAFLSVVEDLNTASVQGNRKMNSIKYGNNYLIKWLGKNLISYTKLKGFPPKILIVPLKGNDKKL